MLTSPTRSTMSSSIPQLVFWCYSWLFWRPAQTGMIARVVLSLLNAKPRSDVIPNARSWSMLAQSAGITPKLLGKSDGFVVEDAGSRNGTFLNGQLLSGAQFSARGRPDPDQRSRVRFPGRGGPRICSSGRQRSDVRRSELRHHDGRRPGHRAAQREQQRQCENRVSQFIRWTEDGRPRPRRSWRR